MINLHVLTSGFTTPNGCAFLYPIYKFSSYLKKNGIKIKIFKTVSRSILDCDIICVDSKFYKRFWLNSKKRTRIFFKLKNKKKSQVPVSYLNNSRTTVFSLK